MSRVDASPRLSDLLVERARRDERAIAFTAVSSASARTCTYGETLAAAQSVCCQVAAGGLANGDRALIACGDPLSFIAGFFGVMLAGGIAVPVPSIGTAGSRAQARLRTTSAACGACVVVCDAADADAVTGGLTMEPGSRPVLVHPLASPDSTVAGRPAVQRASSAERLPGVAFLQYTSGSVSRPKGVVVSHTAALAQCRQAARAFDETRSDCAVTWVPLSYDMGLVTGVLRPIASGYRSVLLDTSMFLRDPRTWLTAISEHRATMSSAPNFGYEHCLRHVTSEDVEDLDLSTWRVARTAGEHVAWPTINEFSERFGPVGFSRTAFCPSYGLAEAVLTVTTVRPGDEPRALALDRGALAAGQAELSDIAPAVVVSCGAPLDETRIEIVDGEGTELPDGSTGAIAIHAPNVAEGYWGGTPRGGDDWLYTEDIGFISGGELYVLGRTASRLVVRGVTIHAYDLVDAVRAVLPRERRGRVAVLPAPDAASDQRAIICAEFHGSRAEGSAFAGHVVAAIGRMGVPTQAILVPIDAVPLTSTGKIDEHALRSGLSSASIAEIARCPP